MADNEEFESTGIEEEIYLRADNLHQTIENVNLYLAIMNLNDEQRLIIRLYAFEGLKQQEIVRCLGISGNVVQKRLNTIRKKIRGNL